MSLDSTDNNGTNSETADVGRRNFLKGAIGTAAIIGTGLPGANMLTSTAIADEKAKSPSLILINGKIATVDKNDSIQEAVAIVDNKIIAVGKTSDIRKLATDKTKIVDLKGKTAIPGLNDSHMHFVREGMQYNKEVRWDGVDSVEEALELIRKQAARTPEGQWVRVIGGFSWEQFKEKRMPTLEEINAVAPKHPVFILYLYAYALLNKKAIEYLGYNDADAPIYPGGRITRDGAGRATGLLVANPSGLLLYKSISSGPKLSHADQYNSSLHFQREMHRFGVTSTSDCGGGGMVYPEAYHIIQKLNKDDKLRIRTTMYTFPQIKGQELSNYQKWTARHKVNEGDAMLKLGGAGENICWAAYDFEIFAMPRPNIDDNAEIVQTPILRQLAYAGWPTRQHMTYNQTIDRLLPVYEKVRKEVFGDPTKAPLMVVDHAETITEKNIERIAKMNGTIAVQNRIIYQAADYIARYGKESIAQTPPVRKMLEAGLKVAGGTDATRVSSYNPWLSLSWLVTGKSLGGIQMYGDDNLLNRSEALRLWTINGAYSTGEEKVKGSIEPGKYADITVLNNDYFSIPDNDIRKLEAEMTIVDGDITYAVGTFKDHDVPALPVISPSWSPVAKFGGYR